MTSPPALIRSAAAWMLAITMLGAPAARAGVVSLQGSFDTDDAQFVTDFELAGAQRLSARTWSYAGGVNAAGDSVAGGGFAPVLALFHETLGLVQLARGSSQACGPGSGAADAASGFCWDALFGGVFSAGHYWLVLTQDGNEPLGNLPGDGYAQDGAPDYTGVLFLGEGGRSFVQVDGAQRDGHWALDLSIGAAAVPLPGTLALLLAGGAGWIGSRRARRLWTQQEHTR